MKKNETNIDEYKQFRNLGNNSKSFWKNKNHIKS